MQARLRVRHPGLPSHDPPDATLQFEVELFSWTSDNDSSTTGDASASSRPSSARRVRFPLRHRRGDGVLRRLRAGRRRRGRRRRDRQAHGRDVRGQGRSLRRFPRGAAQDEGGRELPVQDEERPAGPSTARAFPERPRLRPRTSRSRSSVHARWTSSATAPARRRRPDGGRGGTLPNDGAKCVASDGALPGREDRLLETREKFNSRRGSRRRSRRASRSA